MDRETLKQHYYGGGPVRVRVRGSIGIWVVEVLYDGGQVRVREENGLTRQRVTDDKLEIASD